MVDKAVEHRDEISGTMLHKFKSSLRAASSRRRAYQVEVRLIVDIQSRRQHQVYLRKLHNRLDILEADIKALERRYVTSWHPSTELTNFLAEASTTQDQTESALLRIKNKIIDCKSISIASLEQLVNQRQSIICIDREKDRVDQNLERSEKLIGRLRRMLRR